MEKRTSLRLLMLEDDPLDAELEITALEEAGFDCQWTRVETRAAFLAELDAPQYDVILADFNLPSFDGLTALRLFLDRRLDFPFILVSGNLGEETAIESLKAGATDYVLKSRLSRLGLAVQRALREKAGERQQREAEEDRRRLSSAVNQVAEAVVITDLDGRILYLNPAFEKMTGYTRAEAVGTVAPVLERQDQTAAAGADGVRSAVSMGRTWHGRLVNLRKDGMSYTADTTVGPVRDEHGTIVNYVAVQRDVTNELRMEAQYRQAQKMEAMGRLAGGVAHDFNNLLTAIVGYTQLLLDRIPPDSDLRRDLVQIDGACERATTLVRSLLTFSRRDPSRPEVLDLNAVVNNVAGLLRRVIGEDVELISQIGSDVAAVRADPGQIEQLLMNLSVNARDAMPGGGRLVIQTEAVTLDADQVPKGMDLVPGCYARLSVSDTGVGMEEQVLGHLFEPFFTTKPAGEGTGLGLSIVYGIVKRHNGYITVESRPRKGTTFRIYLPVVAGHDAPTATPITPALGGASRGGQEMILLVEDEAPVRMLVQRALEGAGYRVLPAADASAAIDAFRAHAQEIVLLVTDVVMPDTNGPALFEALTKDCPSLKVLFLSGYAGEIVRGRGVMQDAPFLQKPFKLADLSRRVREILDK
ncbi:MAG TPA: response regulator [Vicinamibacterales bacterium]